MFLFFLSQEAEWENRLQRVSTIFRKKTKYLNNLILLFPGPFMPEPGWVIKLLRVAGEKIFVNLCEHAEVPSNDYRCSIFLSSAFSS